MERRSGGHRDESICFECIGEGVGTREVRSTVCFSKLCRMLLLLQAALRQLLEPLERGRSGHRVQSVPFERIGEDVITLDRAEG